LAIFTTNIHAENQCLINQKCVCGVLNRQFIVGAVSGSLFFSVVLCALACKLFFIFSDVALCVAKNKNVLANALALCRGVK